MEYGFDEVELKNYSVLLSYPNESNHNVVELQDETGQVLFSADTAQEPPLTPGENDSTVASPFNAYAGVGNASVSLYSLVLSLGMGAGNETALPPIVPKYAQKFICSLCRPSGSKVPWFESRTSYAFPFFFTIFFGNFFF